jgi:branched-chain amino acid transport system permease protein
LVASSGLAAHGQTGRRVAIALAAGAALLYPLPFDAGGYVYYETVGFLVLLNAMLGVGWNIIGGWAGQFDFGPNVFFAIGAYTAALLAIHWGWNAWLGLVAAALVSSVICAVVTYPITRLRGHYFAIATVAMWMIAQPIGATWELINGSRGVFIPLQPATSFGHGIVTLEFAGRSKGLGFYYVTLALCALTLWAARVVERSKLGFYFRAIRDDQEGAEGIGIDSRLYKVTARCLMAAVFAVGGVAYSFWALAVFPDQVLDVNWSVLPMMAAVVGGIGHLWGPVLGAIILIPISQLMTTTLGAGALAGRGIDLIIYGAIIMVIAGWRPNGLLSLPWSRWASTLLRRPREAEPAAAGDLRQER